ncbi:MAG TPA: nitrous oxide reductase family maturation protein NosD [Tepidiformaceae bacterium]
MSVATHSDIRGGKAEPVARFARIDMFWASSAIIAAVLLAIAAFQPLWTLELKAPQYPAGLFLTAYGSRMEGDISEINNLNHYVGVKVIEPDTVLELKLFPYAMTAVILGLVAGAVLIQRRRYRVLVALVVWAIPVAFLIDMQYWLYDFGHDLNPDAPLRLDPFTPKVIGTTSVINFHSETMVTTGFWLMVAAALVITAGPTVARFLRDSWNNTGQTAALVVLAVAGASVLALAGSPSNASATTGSISDAIDQANPGDTVVIPAGTYAGPIVIDKPLTLVGEGMPVIDGGGKGDVVRIEAENVTFKGFVVQNTSRSIAGEPAGIRVLGHNAVIESNRLVDTLYGIVLDESNGHLVRNNSVSSMRDFPPERRGHGLYVWYSTGSLIEGNSIQDVKDGVFLGFAKDTRVENNVVQGVRYGLHTMYSEDLTIHGNVFKHSLTGASLMYSDGMVLSDNEFSYNRSRASGFGLLLKDMDNVEMRGNLIHHNRLGLMFDGAPFSPSATVELRGNLIGFNDVAMELFTTTAITFVENSFIGNLQQVESRGGSLERRNTWSVDGRGNYWDDYRGYDATGDGVGDLEYRYEGAFDDLVRQNEALRAYAHTPARSALDLAARWFPVYRPDARVVDQHPLMSPTITLRSEPSGSDRRLAGTFAAVLVSLPLLAFWLGRRSFVARWQPC